MEIDYLQTPNLIEFGEIGDYLQTRQTSLLNLGKLEMGKTEHYFTNCRTSAWVWHTALTCSQASSLEASKRAKMQQE